ncbi:hypothetical protein [Kitasatospora cheerisanensis]|uniref:hypothetical protein n=1 Tax=Kitasatospora cheerisanensis TaxID=81942 RepID=UPI00068BBC19|nr:hypothetical protein [Kitasatospora cheerisanensis]
MNDYEPLLARVRAAATGSEHLREPLTRETVDAAEQQLGFRLHPLLAALHTTVGNGGFGPHGSLLALCDTPPTDRPGTSLSRYLTVSSRAANDPSPGRRPGRCRSRRRCG